MGHGDSSWQDRKHHIGKTHNKKRPLNQITPVKKMKRLLRLLLL